MMQSLDRHHLIWLTDAGWQRLQAAVPDADTRQHAVLTQWQQRQWPVVARRSDVDVAPGEHGVGIALPPDAQGNKPRIALRVREDEIASTAAPLSLQEIAAAPPAGLPPTWNAGMAELQEQAVRAGIGLSVFGSLSWQALTGQPYVRSTSDIDLLFKPLSREALAAGVRLLAYQAMFLPLDGEIVFPDGVAVSWKEWRQVAVLGGDPSGRVLAKSPNAVKLVSVGELEAQLPPQKELPCAA